MKIISKAATTNLDSILGFVKKKVLRDETKNYFRFVMKGYMTIQILISQIIKII